MTVVRQIVPNLMLFSRSFRFLSSCANTRSRHVGLCARRSCRSLGNRLAQCRRSARYVATPPPLPYPVRESLPLAACRPHPWNPPCWRPSPRTPGQLLPIGAVPDKREGPEAPASLVPLSPTIASRNLGQCWLFGDLPSRERWTQKSTLRAENASKPLP
jgi:hypothetical protein